MALPILAPVTSFLCEEVWANVPECVKWSDVASVHLLHLLDTSALCDLLANNADLDKAALALERLRSDVTAAVDQSLKCGELENASQANVTLPMCDELAQLVGDELPDMLSEYFGVSECFVVAAETSQNSCRVCDGSGSFLSDTCPLCDGDSLFCAVVAANFCHDSMSAQHLPCVQKTTKHKCPRCWRFAVVRSKTENQDSSMADKGGLCMACEELVGQHTLAQLMKQYCCACGKFGHLEEECKMKKKSKGAKLAGA
jgi:isoleucyl-tRNA synthetase